MHAIVHNGKAFLLPARLFLFIVLAHNERVNVFETPIYFQTVLQLKPQDFERKKTL